MEYTLRRNRSEHWEMDSPHLHDQYELLLSLTDGGSFFLMDNLHPLHRGTLILMGDRILHRSAAIQGAYDRYVLHVSREALRSMSTDKTDLTAIFAENRCVQLDEASTRQLAFALERCIGSGTEYGADLMQDCALIGALVTVGRLLAQPALCTVRPEGLSAPVRQAIACISARLQEELSLDALAEQCYVTKYYLCRLFKAETGFTVGEYILRLRILRAAELLRAGETVQRAGEEAGFANCSSFIRAFSRLMGMSPGRYGKQQKRKENL